MNQNLPSVSVIIPARNEEQYIKKCVESLLNNSYSKELVSIYVCDGLSDDQTRNIVKQISSNNPQVHLLDNNKQTTPFALNIGLKESTADIKIILGAHSEVDTEFISESVKAYNNGDSIGCTGGILENVYENKTSEIIGLAMSSSFGVGNAHFRTGNKDGFVDTVAFGAYKKEVFEKAGYFDESLTRNQDDEFNYRILKNGFKIYLSKAIKCKYFVRGTYKKLFRQYYQYGYWKVFVNKKHGTVTSIRQLIPLGFVLFLIFGTVSSLLHNYLLYSFLAILGTYFTLSLYSAFTTAKNKAYTLPLVYSFLILHLSYGFGYLFGIFDFLIFNKNPNKKDVKMSR